MLVGARGSTALTADTADTRVTGQVALSRWTGFTVLNAKLFIFKPGRFWKAVTLPLSYSRPVHFILARGWGARPGGCLRARSLCPGFAVCQDAMELYCGPCGVPMSNGNFDQRIKQPRAPGVGFSGLFRDEFGVLLDGVHVCRPKLGTFRAAVFWYVVHLRSLASRSVDKIGRREKSPAGGAAVGAH